METRQHPHAAPSSGCSSAKGGRRLRRILREEQGVGLLPEVVVATFLLAVVVVPVFCGISATALAARRVQMVTEAQQLLQARAEEIKALGGVVLAEGIFYIETYEGEPFTIEQEVVYTGMTLNPDNPDSACVVKKVILRAYREPMREGDAPITFMEFLIYDQGI